MVLQSSGLISASQIAAEFSMSNPIKMSQLYSKGTLQSSGLIKFSQLYGQTAVSAYSYPISNVPGYSVADNVATSTDTTNIISYHFSSYGFNSGGSMYIYDLNSGNNSINGTLASNSTTTSTTAGSLTGAYIQLQTSRGFKLQSYTMGPYNNGYAKFNEWYICASTDGSTWVRVDHQVYSGAWNAWSAPLGGLLTFTLATKPSVAYTYYRMVIVGVTGDYANIVELSWHPYLT